MLVAGSAAAVKADTAGPAVKAHVCATCGKQYQRNTHLRRHEATRKFAILWAMNVSFRVFVNTSFMLEAGDKLTPLGRHFHIPALAPMPPDIRTATAIKPKVAVFLVYYVLTIRIDVETFRFKCQYCQKPFARGCVRSTSGHWRRMCLADTKLATCAASIPSAAPGTMTRTKSRDPAAARSPQHARPASTASYRATRGAPVDAA